MKAMILAAGRGERMRPLTDHTPKPLLAVRGKPLIQWHVEALARAGVLDIVINTAWLEERLVEALGDGERFGLRIRYSMEGRDHGRALETAGGLAKALPWLRDGEDDNAPFWLVSGDIFCPGFDFAQAHVRRFEAGSGDAHLWLVENPPYHPDGDFGLGTDGLCLADGPGPDGRRWTYANLALCRPRLVHGVQAGTRAALGPILFEAMRHGLISGELYDGTWENVGTPAQLEALNRAG
jgi:MurNAc alpha-1-phosphate uridylyltransferase